jgi:hypothetical protein
VLATCVQVFAIAVSSQQPFYPASHVPPYPYTHFEIIRCGTPGRTKQAFKCFKFARAARRNGRNNQGRKPKSGHKKTSLQAGSFVVDSDEPPTLLRL